MSAAMWKSFRSLFRVLGMIALLAAVTVGGVMAGALFTSPMAASMPWIRPAVIVVAIVGASIGLMLWLKPAKQSMPSMPTLSLPSFSMPSMSLSLGGKGERSQQAVQAMAAAGSAPTEISWRTGLPVDAVALLLAMSSASRQLQPPTA